MKLLTTSLVLFRIFYIRSEPITNFYSNNQMRERGSSLVV
jgi:hypothetical protein